MEGGIDHRPLSRQLSVMVSEEGTSSEAFELSWCATIVICLRVTRRRTIYDARWVKYVTADCATELKNKTITDESNNKRLSNKHRGSVRYSSPEHLYIERALAH